MPVHHLTDRSIAELPVPSETERQRDYWDDKLRGFGVRVSYGGNRASSCAIGLDDACVD